MSQSMNLDRFNLAHYTWLRKVFGLSNIMIETTETAESIISTIGKPVGVMGGLILTVVLLERRTSTNLSRKVFALDHESR